MGALLAVVAFQLTIAPVRRPHVNNQVLAQPLAQSIEAAPPADQQQEPKPEKNEVVAALAVAKPQPPIHEQWMTAAGIAPEDWPHVDYIMSQESGWCTHKWEGQIGYCPTSYTERFSPANPNVGYGLCQSTPAIKMASLANDWRDNPVTQLKWCAKHAQGYGGWAPAAAFKRCTGWCYSPPAKQTVKKNTPWW